MTTGPGAHSILGFSGAKRWMACPGSVALSHGIRDEESDHAAIGTAAHAVAEVCLRENRDTWELIGETLECVTVTRDMAVAVQVYVDAIRQTHPERNQGNSGIERRFHAKDIHDLAYGTIDFYCIDEVETDSHVVRILHIWDYKNGAGVIVDPEWNPQCMGYAAGAMYELDLWTSVEFVVIHIVQPNLIGYPAHKTWSISTPDLWEWTSDKLVPAMQRALTSGDLASGEHCRFCPVRSRACPQLAADMDELEELMQTIEKTPAAELTNAQVSRFLDLLDLGKIVGKAMSALAFERLSAGNDVPGRKLVTARANRVWKPEAEAAIVAKFGDDAYEARALKSPPSVEKMPEGSALVAQHAFKPPAGLTVVKADDARTTVSRDTKSMFSPVKRGASRDAAKVS